jgi:hypothetical protein
MPRTATKRPVGRPRKKAPVRKQTVFERILEDDADDTRVDETLNQRHETYGYFIGVAEISQDLKRALFYYLTARDKDLAPDQTEALEMILHKIARIVNGDENHVDSWHDISGYATLVADRLNGNVR